MKILYIDDDAVNRAVVAQMLRIGGVECASAPDAATGVRLVAQADHDLVLMDLRMPEVSGLTAIRQIRALPGHVARVPIIVVTADLTDGVWTLCESAGANGFLEKPVAMPKLFDAVGRVYAASGALVD